MDTPVLDIIDSYEERITAVERVISTAYEATLDTDEELSRTLEERVVLKDNLRDILAKNCSLRYKDFDKLMERILDGMESRKQEIENERRQIRERLAVYLAKHKELTSSLKEQLSKIGAQGSSSDELEILLGKMKASFKDEGEQTFAGLKNFQLKVENFHREQRLLNNKLKGALGRGELLRLEDLRKLEAVRDRDFRRSSRRARRDDISRMLDCFRYERRRNWIGGQDDNVRYQGDY